MFQIVDNKIVLTERALNRVFHGTHKLSDILRQVKGATLLVGITTHDGRQATVPMFKDEQPWDKVVGIELEIEGMGRRFFTDFKPSFMLSSKLPGQPFKVNGIKCNGLPLIVRESWDQKTARLQPMQVTEHRIDRIT